MGGDEVADEEQPCSLHEHRQHLDTLRQRYPWLLQRPQTQRLRHDVDAGTSTSAAGDGNLNEPEDTKSVGVGESGDDPVLSPQESLERLAQLRQRHSRRPL